MTLDPATILLTFLVVTLLLGALLSWAWWVNRTVRALRWWALGYMAVALGIGLVSGRGAWPDFLTIDLANSALLAGHVLMWRGARVFNGRAPRPWLSLLPMVLWLGFCQIPAFHTEQLARVELYSLLSGTMTLVIAGEFFRSQDSLRLRLPPVLLICAHAGFILARGVLVATGVVTLQALRVLWFPLSGLEGIAYLVTSAFLLLGMAMARIAQEHRAESELDYLTGAANRRGLFACGAALLRQAQRKRLPSALILFDLDRFKQINDTLGHKMGDRVLTIFGAVAREGVRKTDLLGRLGGDEFAVLLPGLSAAQAEEIARRIAARFAEACRELGETSVPGGTSFGVAISDESQDTLPDLLDKADRALYRQKHERRRGMAVVAATG